jgi:glycosyltransferase involved in cell wall biosynthesis
VSEPGNGQTKPSHNQPGGLERVQLTYLINQLGYGGAQRLILHLVQHLDRERFDIAVAMLGGRKSLCDDFEGLGVEVVDFGANGKFAPRAWSRFYRFVRRRPVDILHAHLPYSGMVSRLLGKLARVPALIYTEQNVEGAFHPLTRTGNRLTLHLADVFTGITGAIEAGYYGESAPLSVEAWMQGRRHFTIHSGVDIDLIDAAVRGLDIAGKRAELGLSSDSFCLACVARLRPVKGHFYLLQAMRSLEAKHPICRLLVLGDGPLEAELKQLTQDLGLQRKVSFLGYRRDVYEILAAVDCFVLPSLHEGFGIAIAEAMALSKPVIATRIPAVSEVVSSGRTGLLVQAAQADALAAAIARLIEQPDLVRRLGHQGRQRVERLFSIQAAAAQYELLYDLVTKDYVLPRRAKRGSRG